MKSWIDFINEEKNKIYLRNILNDIKRQRSEKIIYPKDEDIFNAFKYFDIDQTKVVVLGQDPYHSPNKAEGLSFSVHYPEKLPPSLRNIFKELNLEYNSKIPHHGSLVNWAKQGVLLLNTSLTVEKSKPTSHAKIGWDKFAIKVIEKINNSCDKVVFILLGNHAKEFEKYIDINKHITLKTTHPSPFSANNGFFCSNIFKRTNKILLENGKKAINWSCYEMMIFDLDGTIIDTLETLTYSINNMLNKFGYEKISKELVRTFLGGGVDKLLIRIARTLNIDNDLIIHMKKYLLHEYEIVGTKYSKEYPNVSSTLKELKKYFKLGVYTNKPHNIAKVVINEFFPDIFDFVIGNIEGIKPKPSVDGIKNILGKLDIPFNNIIYVGDSEVDMITGIESGMKTVAVTWGYEDINKLKGYKSSYFINEFEELLLEVVS